MRSLICLALCLLPLCSEAKPPNIIYIMVDDMGPKDAGFLGSTTIKTPSLDQLSTQSLLFTEAYSGCTVCGPCRSVLMTGKHMGRTSVRLNTGGVPLLDSDVTIAEVLKKSGYITGGFGKWGIGDIGTTGVPEKQGFDIFYGYYHQIHAHKHYPSFLVRNGKKEPITSSKPGTKEGYAPEMIFAEMKKFIRSAAEKNQPFFCYAPWTPPHGGYKFPKDDPIWKLYADKKWKGNQKGHAAMVTLVDRHLGQTLALLDELNIRDNTIIFFHSDNGAPFSLKQAPDINSSGPYRGHKRSPYEGGLRAPTLVHWKGKIKAAKNTSFIISSHDALPTLAELAGATNHVPKDITGLSYAPVLFGKTPEKVHQYHYWEWALWDWGKKRLVPHGNMQSLRMGNWKIARVKDNIPWELYDLSKDPGEQNNLAKQHPEIVAQLANFAKEAHQPMRPQTEPKHPKGKHYN